MEIKLPQKVKDILDVIEANGYEAYVVGGCVRDSILGREPGDWDITTSARPEEIKALFRKTIDTGIAHGTVTVMQGKEGFEVTTYRVDGEYEDGRHPNEVVFTPDLKEDLRRRDFTINAMAYNEKEGLIDLYNGMYDLKYRNIRCVGNADERFDEDALRILRAVRFAAQLDFGIERETYAAICRHAENLRKVSSERIQVEIVKILTSPNPEKWLDLYRNKTVEDGISAMQEVSGSDEWLCEAYMKTDYSKLCEADFQQTLNNYLAYQIKEGKIYES